MYKAKQFFFAGIISDKRGELLINQRKSLKELNLLDNFCSMKRWMIRKM